MSTSAIKVAPLALEAACTDTTLTVRLADGREISAPLEWFPKLRAASPEARREWRLVGGGIGLHWPQLDEDISVAGLLATH